MWISFSNPFCAGLLEYFRSSIGHDIRLEVGTRSAGSSPKWNGIPASYTPALALSSPPCRGPPNGWLRFIIIAGWYKLDAAVMQQVPQQRGSSPASRPGLQSGQLHADACVAEKGGTLVVDHATGKTGEDRGPLLAPKLIHGARPVITAADDRGDVFHLEKFFILAYGAPRACSSLQSRSRNGQDEFPTAPLDP